MSTIVTYTDILPVDRAAAEWLSRKLAAHRRVIGTRKGTRRLTPWSHAVYTLRFLIDGTRIKQLAASNALPKTTAYTYLWEGLEVLASCAPALHDAIDAARTAGDTHIGLDGTLIPTNRVKVEGPTEGCDLFYSGKHHRHGVNLQVISAPDGFPLWIGEAQPGCEHDTTAAYRTGVEEAIALINVGVPEEAHLLVLVDLGYEKFRDFPAVRMGHKKPHRAELTDTQRQYNKVIGALRTGREGERRPQSPVRMPRQGRTEPLANRHHRPRLSRVLPHRTPPPTQNCHSECRMSCPENLIACSVAAVYVA